MNNHGLNSRLSLENVLKCFLIGVASYINHHPHFKTNYQRGNESNAVVFNDIATTFRADMRAERARREVKTIERLCAATTGSTLMKLMHRYAAARALFVREQSVENIGEVGADAGAARSLQAETDGAGLGFYRNLLGAGSMEPLS